MKMSPAKGVHSFGKELRSCQLDGIRISETLMPAGLRLDEHSHAAGQICFVLEGEYRESARERDHWLRPGMLQFHSPGERHSNTFSAECDVFTLLISIDPARWVQIDAQRPMAADAFVRDFGAQIRCELGQLDDARRAALEGWAMLSLSAVARRHDYEWTGEPPWLSEAIALIRRRAAEPISLRTVAAAIGVHRATLAAAFRRFRNISVGEAIRHERVCNVTRALVGSKTPLCEIAVQWGFHDQAHMGRVFRKTTGVSPGAYRSGRRTLPLPRSCSWRTQPE
jgi:AraC family transcriptional regulator